MFVVKTVRFLFCVIGLVCAFSACSEKAPNTNRASTMEDFADFSVSHLSINSHHIRSLIDSLIRNDHDGLTADFKARSYYLNDGDFLWVSRKGVSFQADTLLEYLKGVGRMGFSPKRFCVPQIEEDLRRARLLDVDDQHNMNKLLARLEYRLTKAYLRYVTGQRFGYMNPTFLFNRLDTLKPNKVDTIARPVRYRGLFDVKMEHAGKMFYAEAFRKIANDSVRYFLKEVQPRNEYYQLLEQKYVVSEGTSKAWRVKLLCNMERFRWRLADSPLKHQKYVLVNIPSFHLMAVDEADTLLMRIGCGSNETKTPLLNSLLKRMDVNPKWNVPRSIVEKDISRYWSRSYFERRGFYVMDRKTGKEVDIRYVTTAMLHDPSYAVVQKGGKGNSLGRLIFRFDNNFSVYLHDTSSRDVFSREDRGVSHGCVRVEKPFELAKFLLKGENEKFFENLDYCMTSDSLADKSKIIGSKPIQPMVPVFLYYYTIYPLGSPGVGVRLEEYPDVYGYDQVIYDFIKRNYL